MLKINEIHELIKRIDESSIDEFVYEIEGVSLKLKKNEAPAVNVTGQAQAVPAAYAPAPQAAKPEAHEAAPVQEAPKQDENLHKITSPMVGTFYASSSPEAGPYVNQGSKVSENTVVCIVEAMKLFNEIEAEVKGEIVEVLVENGQLVEYGQPLFLVKAE
ncbi:acetyl-CoA carboxylase, biotin carboxyl carrier protein [Bacillus amyloliquefaciens]|jgi:acetyl-CoA carboxylase biotin carboxyl carrier protein|uniref:Biotin carboxyl carrier protein of acetyl-CoA carboxylase n=1 Tax=Bacillus velezensis TaxID=492670 RepID=A0A6A8LI18_BACVE|nr:MULTISPECIES: acetyl-CoA carboxylase biotin carboxyl carrier protein [Bacillus]AIU78066.1 acetyl-CoA carboxylase [Bacillus subtilis]UXZ16568.1 acetyl-CoA carboxylase biotin carboxyl carrier protein [Bacillus siamensis]COC67552.1 acetyl-CoA carboxylase biotin carboxyl carrier protein subunit [Streptococcus pneumoniae]AGF27104.1 acetyl-CoA carboxylase biotin carboxyl carrier protein subunit [Bacillus amyloliquefaciens IT-45]AHC42860.1 acetyl-CoA carboxylase [Bacillus amyloliquefaciens LFB112]